MRTESFVLGKIAFKCLRLDSATDLGEDGEDGNNISTSLDNSVSSCATKHVVGAALGAEAQRLSLRGDSLFSRVTGLGASITDAIMVLDHCSLLGQLKALSHDSSPEGSRDDGLTRETTIDFSTIPGPPGARRPFVVSEDGVPLPTLAEGWELEGAYNRSPARPFMYVLKAGYYLDLTGKAVVWESLQPWDSPRY